MPKKTNLTYLEINYEVGDYVQIKNSTTNAIIIYKTETNDTTGKRKYKYTVVDNDYNKRTYYADQLIKLRKTNDTFKDNVKYFKKR